MCDRDSEGKGMKIVELKLKENRKVSNDYIGVRIAERRKTKINP